MYTKLANEIPMIKEESGIWTTHRGNAQHDDTIMDVQALQNQIQKIDGHLWNGQPFMFQESSSLGDSFSSLDSEQSSQSTSSSSNSSKDRKTKKRLPDSFRPTNYSVVFGRGAECFNATGNRRFRATAQLFLSEYADSKTKLEKSAIVSKLVDLVRESSPEGAFVRYEEGTWWEVSDAVAREKVGAQLRDLLHTKYRSSTKAKLEKRKKATSLARQRSFQTYHKLSTPPQHQITKVGSCSIEKGRSDFPNVDVNNEDVSNPIALSEEVDPMAFTKFSSLLESLCLQGSGIDSI